MKFKIITSNEGGKIEIENGDDLIVIREAENGNLRITHQSLDKDLKILPLSSNSLELEFRKKERRGGKNEKL